MFVCLSVSPTATAVERLVQVSVGHTAHLVCRFTGHPDSISWYHAHTRAPVVGSRFSVTRYIHEDIGTIDSRLSIDKVTTHDYGYYLCTASNIYASTEATIQLYGIYMFLYVCCTSHCTVYKYNTYSLHSYNDTHMLIVYCSNKQLQNTRKAYTGMSTTNTRSNCT